MSQSRRADDDSLPQTAAVGVDVVGRRTPTWAISAPARTLNRLDLPLPVAPASATTVRPPTTKVRAAVLAMTTSARSTPPAGRQPAPDCRADVNAAALARTTSADTPSRDTPSLESAGDPTALKPIASPADSSRRRLIARPRPRPRQPQSGQLVRH